MRHVAAQTRPVAGMDIGSLSTETVVLQGDRVLGSSLLPTGADPRRAAERSLEAALEKAGLCRSHLAMLVATGYGRVSAPRADERVTEITCHARGARRLLPGVGTVIDIGGQDSKVIRLDPSGRVADFVMNDRCAAGTGRFLEVMARALEVPLEELGSLGLSAPRGLPISSLCTVFAESEVVSLLAQGHPRPEIIRGLHESIAQRIQGMAERVGLAPPVLMSGGVANNRGVVEALKARLRVDIAVPPEPQMVGALGAALLAAEMAEERGSGGGGRTR
ncbi:MAG: acyl-CoA dehydratase activase [Acetobacteraceae bacterium]|nr:acyl-CoA dehydratase activase [Acetobacteraceae bacterium]